MIKTTCNKWFFLLCGKIKEKGDLQWQKDKKRI